MARELGAALAAPASADSAAKGKFKFAESRRKKNEEKRKNFKELFINSNSALVVTSSDDSSLTSVPLKKSSVFCWLHF